MAKYRISRYWKSYKNPVTGKEELPGDGDCINEYVIEKKTLLTMLFGNTWEPVNFECYKSLCTAKEELERIVEKEREAKRRKSAKKHRETVCEIEI